MTQEALTTELLSMRKQAERTVQNINQISHNLSVERQSLRQMVSEYSAKRVELFKHELQAREMTWCTYCSKMVPENEVEFLLVEGREEYSHGYENTYFGFRDFSKLHRACLTCRERAADKHGMYNSQAKDHTSFYAFRVEKREDDGYCARKFGNWVKLNDKNYTLDEPSSQLVEKLVDELNLPPRIVVESN